MNENIPHVHINDCLKAFRHCKEMQFKSFKITMQFVIQGVICSTHHVLIALSHNTFHPHPTEPFVDRRPDPLTTIET